MPNYGKFQELVEKIDRMTNPKEISQAIQGLRLILAEEDIDFQSVKTVSLFLAQKELASGLATSKTYMNRLSFIDTSYKSGLAQEEQWKRAKLEKDQKDSAERKVKADGTVVLPPTSSHEIVFARPLPRLPMKKTSGAV